VKVGDKSLKQAGSVDGLGEGEQIKSVRFVGDTGYVVTFRQTDPLYTVDLSNPKKPRTTGELKIPGYSAYLHPVSGDRLIGVGKDGDEDGNLTGAQVGLYDVGDPEDPTEMDRYSIPGGTSEVEHDPHAFLYWPDREYVIVPVSDGDDLDVSTLVLKVGKDGLSKVGTVEQDSDNSYSTTSRSIVIGTALWTITDEGMKASDLDSLTEREWLAYE
ncbi:MAG: beta-propeller domain-containing protein, partial [Stackebrandtia sp.]